MMAEFGPPIERPGVRAALLPDRTRLAVRGRDGTPALVAAVAAALGFAPPVAANTVAASGEAAALWLAPGEWRIVGPAEARDRLVAALEAAVPRTLAGVVDVSDGHVGLRLDGPAAHEVLARGCPLDLDVELAAPASCARSLLGGVGVLLLRADAAPHFEIEAPRSYAAHLWRWLEAAAATIAGPLD